KWLDPKDPPTATTYYRWIRAIKGGAEQIPGASQKSLSELGVELGRLANASGPSEEARKALQDIESALGIVGKEAVRELVRTRPAPSAEADEKHTDVDALQRVLDGHLKPLRDRIRTLLCDPAFAYADTETPKEEMREIVLRWTKLLADQGIGALAYPEYAGGEDDIEQFIASLETIAYHDLSLTIKFGVQFGLFGGSINALGSEDQKRKYLADAGTLELPGCFAMTERGHGSNVRDLQTTATYDPSAQEFVINTPGEQDHKEWIGNAARHARMATVFAQLVIDDQQHGVHAFLVPIRDDEGNTMPNVRIGDSGHKLGLNGIDNGRIWFDDARIPRENLLGRFAQVAEDGTYTSPIPSSSRRFFTMLGTLVGGRIGVGSAGLSAAKSALTIAVRYGAKRRQFGPKDRPEVPVLDYLSHQRRLLPRVATCYALNFALHDLAHRYGQTPESADIREIEAEAAALKAFATDHATSSIQEAREACGGEGYRASNRFAALKADSDIFTTFEGDNTVLLLQAAKGLLSGYQQEFSHLDFFGLIGKLAERVEMKIGEVNPIKRHQSDTRHLLDPNVHLDLFRDRERDLQISAASRLKGRIDDGMDSFDAFTEVQDHLITLAKAYAERLVLESFQQAVEKVDEGDVKHLLADVCALYALRHIEKDRGWFLEQRYIDATKAKAVRSEINNLLTRLRPVAVDLVDAFGIPDQLLAAPIAVES
ncbi:MAG: acyl-CoA dehydrogenase, partial [Rubricoccaceae bacterium]|nr:acyl-CoA dehydrogenase [Rubricoccaceae bacterium]